PTGTPGLPASRTPSTGPAARHPFPPTVAACADPRRPSPALHAGLEGRARNAPAGTCPPRRARAGRGADGGGVGDARGVRRSLRDCVRGLDIRRLPVRLG